MGWSVGNKQAGPTGPRYRPLRVSSAPCLLCLWCGVPGRDAWTWPPHRILRLALTPTLSGAGARPDSASRTWAASLFEINVDCWDLGPGWHSKVQSFASSASGEATPLGAAVKQVPCLVRPCAMSASRAIGSPQWRGDTGSGARDRSTHQRAETDGDITMVIVSDTEWMGVAAPL